MGPLLLVGLILSAASVAGVAVAIPAAYRRPCKAALKRAYNWVFSYISKAGRWCREAFGRVFGAVRTAYRAARHWWLFYMVYARPIPRNWLTNPWSPGAFLLLLLYTVGNAFLIGAGGTSRGVLARRAGMSAMINLVPLFASHRPEVTAHWLRIQIDSYKRLHGVVAWAVSVVTSAHVIFVAPSLRGWKIQDRPVVSGIIILATLFLLLGMSLPWSRARLYETAVNYHYAMTPILLGGVWFHVPERSTLFKACLIAAVGCHALSWAVDIAFTVFRMRLLTQPWPKVDVHLFELGGKLSKEGIAEMKVCVPRSIWSNYAPGQYVLLNVLDGSFRSRFQRHPFIISHQRTVRVVDNTKEEFVVEWTEPERVISIHPRRGFTRRLRRRLEENGNDADHTRCGKEEVSKKGSFRALISGPFGRSHPVGDYHTLVAVAHYDRLISILPYLFDALMWPTEDEDGVPQRPAAAGKLKCVYLVWQVGVEEQVLQLSPYVDQLLIANKAMEVGIDKAKKANKPVPQGITFHVTVYYTHLLPPVQEVEPEKMKPEKMKPKSDDTIPADDIDEGYFSGDDIEDDGGNGDYGGDRGVTNDEGDKSGKIGKDDKFGGDRLNYVQGLVDLDRVLQLVDARRGDKFVDTGPPGLGSPFSHVRDKDEWTLMLVTKEPRIQDKAGRLIRRRLADNFRLRVTEY